MDLFILLAAIISFINFFILQIVILRLVGSTRILKGMSYSTIVATIFHFSLFFKSFDLVIFFISYIIFILMAIIFIWGFLGVVATSLRIQVLCEIAKSGDKGISYKKLLEYYNREIIIKNRIVRLLDSREIRREGEYYFHNKKFSYFTVHHFLIKVLNILYKKSQYEF